MLETEIVKMLRALEEGRGCDCGCTCPTYTNGFDFIRCFFNSGKHYDYCLIAQARTLRERIEKDQLEATT